MHSKYSFNINKITIISRTSIKYSIFHCEKLINVTIDSNNVHYKAIENVIYKINGDGTLNLILYPYAKKLKYLQYQQM